MNWKEISTPLDGPTVAGLRVSDLVVFSGTVYVARDKAHERMSAMIEHGEALPFKAEGQVLYYMGPSPAPSGRIIGAAGPTTSGRMDPFTEAMLKAGIRGFIGKGARDPGLRPMFQKFGAVYFATFGGAAAYLSKRITASRVIAFEDLGPEAVFALEVKDFPAVVINDIYSGDLYEDAIRRRG